MNLCCFVGALGKDWEKKETKSGTTIYSTSMAVKKYNNETLWINLKCFNKTGETLSQYTGKGSQLAVQTECDINEYEGKYYTSFIVGKFTFVGGKKKEGQQQNNQEQEDD